MTAKELENIFQSIQDLKVMIIGDVMLDSYMWGYVNRISPEAPVPVVAVNKIENRLGGAANVALNVQSLGAEPIIFTIIGNDEKGLFFNDLMKKQNLSAEGVILSNSRKTTVKTRILSGSSQMLRVDEEIDTPLNQVDENALIASIKDRIEMHDIDIIIFEDYDKGIITANLIQEVVTMANALKIPTAADPKKKNFMLYKNVSLFKPNLKELREGLKVDIDADNIKDIERTVDQLQSAINASQVLVTLSELGVYISSNGFKEMIPAHFRDITDVSGAGDTVICVAALCCALRLSAKDTALLSNLAGGIVCEKVGVVPIDKEQLFDEAMKLFVNLQ